MFHLHTRHFLLLIINHYLFEIILYMYQEESLKNGSNVEFMVTELVAC